MIHVEQPTCARCGAKLDSSYAGSAVVLNQRHYAVAPDGGRLYAEVATAMTACGWACAAVLAACEAARAWHPDAAVLVVAERERQVNAEGWEPGHDDTYPEGHLGRAGQCYVASGLGGGPPWLDPSAGPPAAWPLEASWWKPKDKLRDLVRGAALVAAEADRDVRAQRRAHDVEPF